MRITQVLINTSNDIQDPSAGMRGLVAVVLSVVFAVGVFRHSGTDAMVLTIGFICSGVYGLMLLRRGYMQSHKNVR